MVPFIYQESSTGCGVACVAALAGVSYLEAEAIMLALGTWGPRSRRRKTKYLHLEKALRALGRDVEVKRFPGFELLGEVAIVGMRNYGPKGLSRTFHWVVVYRADGEYWVMDPLVGTRLPVAEYQARARRGFVVVRRG